MPLSCSARATSRCSGVISACGHLGRDVLRRHDRFLCLLSQFLEVHRVLTASCPRSAVSSYAALCFFALPSFSFASAS